MGTARALIRNTICKVRYNWRIHVRKASEKSTTLLSFAAKEKG
jgi:hypothetical protein